ncbi:hypothetical protein RMATCC62417_14633 [Rhizopus microsporus]|nr:hypothetical protein RMATCC62417_14633 [Rhizopus microsporus]
MHRTISFAARAAPPTSLRLLRPYASPATVYRSFSSATSKPKASRLPFKSIAASVALTSSFYLYSRSIAEAEAIHNYNTNPSMTTVAELQDIDNRIAVQAKTTEELALALFVYRLCAFPWLVNAAPHLIAAAERLHLQAPIYWFIKQTFFRHFCGGETSEECISSMDKLAQSGINCILDLSVLPPAESQEQEQKRQSIIDHLKREKGTLDLLEFRKLFNLQGPGRDIWWKTSQMNSKSVMLTSEDLEAYDRMIQRVDEACSLAHQLKVGVMVDAEQSYFQNIIDHVAVNLQSKYNRRIENQHSGPTVYNTYQMYTKSARGRLELDVELSKRENFVFAAKLVRGAYMVSERKRALDMNYPSPIHDTLEDTHDSYNGGVKYLVNKLREHQESTGEALTVSNSPIVFMVASHNRDSVILTIEEMEKNHISPHSGVVLFGQLFSMQDQISYTLARHGYAAYKYLPYGMIDEVIPYLLRRAQENSSILGGPGVAHERQLMWDELKSRITGKATKPDVSVNTTTSA